MINSRAVITLPISIEQLLEVVKSLNESDKEQILAALQEGFMLSDEQRETILRREKMCKSGEMKTFTWDEVKTELGR